MERDSLERDATRTPPPEYSSIAPEYAQIPTPLIEDDGRIVLEAKSRLFHTLSRVAAHKDATRPPQATDDLRPTYTSQEKNHPLRLNIVIQVVGSRGDVQPFVALGSELRRRGHRVRLATHDVFDGFVRAAGGLEFYPIGGDPAELMAYMVKNPGLIPRMRSLREGEIRKKRHMVAEMLEGCWRACVEPDPATGRPFVAEAIIANPPSFAHVHCAQALGVPLHLMFTMPWTSTTAFPHPLANIEFGGSSLPVGTVNHISYLAVEWMTWKGLGDLVNSWRTKTLGLDPVPPSEGPRLTETLRIPFTYCWSPALIPKPADWPPYVDVCGFFFRDPPQYDPPAELAKFLHAGPPPVYIGFGSIVIDDPAKLTATILQAVRETGVRAIVSRGWSKLGGSDDDQGGYDYDKRNVMFIGDCPHDWLFQHVAAVVHHGGAGTTACGLLNGRPTTIVPFFGDQPFWGAMVAAAGAGSAPIPQRQLNSKNLAEAIRFCLTPEASVAAERLGAQMRTESGVKAAVDSFHAQLPMRELRCDILRDRAAAWSYRQGRTEIKLSKLAAEILMDNLKISGDELNRYDSMSIVIDPTRWDPVTGTTSSLISTFRGMVVSASDIVIKPVQVYHHSSQRNSLSSTRSEGMLDPAAIHNASKTTTRPNTSYKERDHDNPGEGTTANPSSPSTAQSLPIPSSSSSFSSSSPSSHRSHHQHHHHHHQSKLAAEAIAGSAAGLGGFFKYFFKGMIIDMPLAATEGLRVLPRWYGGEVREIGPVADWKSGAVAAGRNFKYGVADGFADLVREPVKGGQEGGALGAVKGVGKGSVNMISKVSSGVLGLVAYPGHGICKSISTAFHGATARGVARTRFGEGRYLGADEGDEYEAVVLHAFEELLSGEKVPKH